MTICKQCRHMLRILDGPRTDVWYNCYCMAETLPEATDPVTGERGYTRENDLGTICVDSQPYAYCRDVNKGDCTYYEAGTPTTKGRD